MHNDERKSDVRVHERGQVRRTVVLVGFMGAGKTTVGRALAEKLGWSFEDLDDRIVRRESRPIKQIFQQSGEAEFRRAETAALRELLAESNAFPCVVALGGGAFVQAENTAALEEARIQTVFLDAPAEELFGRCAQDGNPRPLRQDLEQFSGLYRSRRPYYMKASIRIDTSGKNIECVAQEIAEHLKTDLAPKER